jgi:hypothetical protein
LSRARSIRLTRLSFTGTGKQTAAVDFGDGLSLVYGGSNAGKSYILKAVDYALGGSKLDGIRQSEGYESVFLSFVLEPDGIVVTTRRSLRGGDIEWFEGAADEGGVAGLRSNALKQKHGKARKSLSERLLLHLGIERASIAATQAGSLETFSLRHFMPFVLVTESRMLGDDTPLKQHSRSKPGADKNAFRFIMTGTDDSTIVKVATPVEQTASNAGKIELLESMIADADTRLARFSAESGEQGLLDEEALFNLGEAVAERQRGLDQLRADRRKTILDVDDVRDEASEIATSLARYGDLELTFQSDIRRLKAIEEGGHFLLRFNDQPCPICGAEPGDQHLVHEAGDLERQHQASVVEIAKVERDLKDLRELMVSLRAQLERLRGRERRLCEDLERWNAQIETNAPNEAALRRDYVSLQARADRERVRGELVLNRDTLQRQLDDLRKFKASRKKAEGITMGIASNVGHDLSMVVADVLNRWEFPGVEAVTWDPVRDDIQVNGWPRTQNGKGVKALLHSAVKVAVLLYCRQKSLPHPGFLFLDSPLLTYRGPMLYERYGAPDEVEQAISQSSLATRFYEHLSSLKDIGQFIVIENTDPPEGIGALAHVHVFSGENGVGRQGLFPPIARSQGARDKA